MRRTVAFLVLTAIAAFWAGCGSSSDQNRTTSPNAPGTTTYGNTTPSTTGGAPATSAPPSNSNANRSPGDTGIKPPTDK